MFAWKSPQGHILALADRVVLGGSARHRFGHRKYIWQDLLSRKHNRYVFGGLESHDRTIGIVALKLLTGLISFCMENRLPNPTITE
jgi:hypothetical protein